MTCLSSLMTCLSSLISCLSRLIGCKTLLLAYRIRLLTCKNGLFDCRKRFWNFKERGRERGIRLLDRQKGNTGFGLPDGVLFSQRGYHRRRFFVNKNLIGAVS